MPNLLFADQQLATQLQKNDNGTRIVLIEQPPTYKWNLNAEEWSYTDIKLPHASGDYLVKETWVNHAYGYGYKADGGEAGGIFDGRAEKYWLSPVTMPLEAVRTHIHLDVEVKKVQGLIVKELISIGMPCTGKALYDGNIPVGVATYDREWFINYCNSLYPGSYERNDWIAVEKWNVTWRKK